MFPLFFGRVSLLQAESNLTPYNIVTFKFKNKKVALVLALGIEELSLERGAIWPPSFTVNTYQFVN